MINNKKYYFCKNIEGFNLCTRKHKKGLDCKGMTLSLLRRHSSCCRPSLLKRGHHRGAAGLVGQDLVNIVHDGVGQLRKKLETVEERDHVVHRVGGEHDTLAGGVPDCPGHHQLAQRRAQPLSNRLKLFHSQCCFIWGAAIIQVEHVDATLVVFSALDG